MNASTSSNLLRRTIIVCALGYAIDVFDIQLFPILRVTSLTELGVPPDQLAAVGGNIFSAQMLGMILGAFLWGHLGDVFGRLKALYGSILVYSAGTLACSFVHDPYIYGFDRFITGFGLAGETGAAITLVAELMSPARRGWGIMVIAGIGQAGPILAVLLSFFSYWRTSYLIAGIFGLLLFILRLRLHEAFIFEKTKQSILMRGSLKSLANRKQATTLLCCILIGFPIVFLWNCLNFFSLELSHSILREGDVFNQKLCMLLFYTGTSLGDFSGATLSQYLKSRRKAVLAVLLLGSVTAAFYLVIGTQLKLSAPVFYTTYFILGLAGGGGWLLFSTIAAEHFGTNIRATTSLLVINLIRGFAIPVVFALRTLSQHFTLPDAALIIGAVLFAVGFIARRGLRETYGLDLDYTT